MKKAERIKDIKNLLQLDGVSLNKELLKAKKELYILQMKSSGGELKQTHLLRLYKKYIARLNTLINKL